MKKDDNFDPLISCPVHGRDSKHIPTQRRMPVDDSVKASKRGVHKDVVSHHILRLGRWAWRGWSLDHLACAKLRGHWRRSRRTGLVWMERNGTNEQLSPEFSSDTNALAWACFEAFGIPKFELEEYRGETWKTFYKTHRGF